MPPNIKKLIQQIVLMVLIFAAGTVLDALIHQLEPEFYVPFWYYRNKVIYGTLLGFIVFKILSQYTKNYRWQAFFVSLIVAVLLQARYYLMGYDFSFILIFMGVHFVAFLIPAIFVFSKFKSVFDFHR